MVALYALLGCCHVKFSKRRRSDALGFSCETGGNFARLKGFRFPREIVAYAVWAYHRFALSTADVEDLLAERGVIVSRQTVRLWIKRFGHHFAEIDPSQTISGIWMRPFTISGTKFWFKPAATPSCRAFFLQTGQTIRLAARRRDGQTSHRLIRKREKIMGRFK